MNLLDIIKENARKQPKRIVLPEGEEERTLKAADEVLKHGYAKIILIGNPSKIQSLAGQSGLGHIGKAKIADPQNFEPFWRTVNGGSRPTGQGFVSRGAISTVPSCFT